MKIQLWAVVTVYLAYGSGVAAIAVHSDADASGAHPSSSSDDWDSPGISDEEGDGGSSDGDGGQSDDWDSKPVHLRASRKRVAPAEDAHMAAELASLREQLKQEHQLRLQSDGLAQKLMVTLNHSTAALRNKATTQASTSNDLKQLKDQNQRLAVETEKAKKELDEARDHVDEAEAARKTKTDELKKKLAEITDLKNKGKMELGALHQKDDEEKQSAIKHLKEEQTKQQAAFERERQQSKDAMSQLKLQLKDLNKSGAQLNAKIQQEKLKVKQAQDQSRQTQQKLQAEHEALKAKEKDMAKYNAQLEKDAGQMRSLKAQADQMRKAQQQIEALTGAPTGLAPNHTNLVEQHGAFDTTIAKLEAQAKDVQDTHQKLKETSAMLKETREAKKKADARINQLWQALKQKTAHGQTHDEELDAIEKQLNATAEQKNVLVQELVAMQSKLADIASRDKEIAKVRSQLSQSQELLKSKDQELDSMRKQIKAFTDRDEESKALRARMATVNAEEKELNDQLAAAERQKKDEVDRRKAEKEEMDAMLAEAAKEEDKLKQKSHEDLLAKEQELKQARDAEVKAKAQLGAEAPELQDQDPLKKAQDTINQEFLLASAVSKADKQLNGKRKASLLTGSSVLRSGNLARELVKKGEDLKSALIDVESMKAALAAKDLELEQARQAVLHAASLQLPSASAVQAAAAKAALEQVDGKLETEEHELNATVGELGATRQQNVLQQEELQVLKDDHTAQSDRVKKLSAALITEHSKHLELVKELSGLKTKMASTEHAKQAADAVRKQQQQEVAAKAAQQEAAAQQAAQEATAQQSAQEAAEKAEAQKTAEVWQAQQAAAQQAAQKAAVSNADDSDDDDSDDDSDNSEQNSGDDAFAGTLNWGKVEKALAKNKAMLR